MAANEITTLSPDNTKLYCLSTYGRLSVLDTTQPTTLPTLSQLFISGITGTPLKLVVTASKLIFSTDANKLYSCDLDGSNVVERDLITGDFVSDGSNVLVLDRLFLLYGFTTLEEQFPTPAPSDLLNGFTTLEEAL